MMISSSNLHILFITWFHLFLAPLRPQKWGKNAQKWGKNAQNGAKMGKNAPKLAFFGLKMAKKVYIYIAPRSSIQIQLKAL